MESKPSEQNRSLLGELKQRRVLRVAVFYAVAAWGVTEIAATVLPALNLPDWTVTLVVALLALGFPVAMVLAWAFDIGPAGVERAPPLPRAGQGWTYGILLVTATVMLSVFLYVRHGTEAAPGTVASPSDTPRVAVLPFADLSPGGEQAYFSDGFHDELIDQLARIPGLAVSSRTAVLPYREVSRPLSEIAAELHADAIVEGTVRHDADRIRVTATLVDTERDETIWRGRFDRERSTRNIFGIQEEVATRIATELRGEVGELEHTYSARLPTTSLQAYELYTLGRHHQWRWQGDDIRKAIGFLQQAVEADPDFAEAHAALAWAYAIAGTSYVGMRPAEAAALARQHAQRAVALSPDIVDAHLVQVDISYWYEWDWESVQARFDELRQRYPDNRGLDVSYAFYLGVTGRADEGVDLLEDLMVRYPGDLSVMANAGWRYVWAGRCADVVELTDRILAIDSTFLEAHSLRGACQHAAGDYEAALESFRQGRHVPMEAYTLGKLGREEEARALIDSMLREREEEGYFPPVMIALALMGLDDRDAVFQWLAAGVEARNRNLIMLNVDPAWAPLRGDPRLQPILREVGLPQS